MTCPTDFMRWYDYAFIALIYILGMWKMTDLSKDAERFTEKIIEGKKR